MRTLALLLGAAGLIVAGALVAARAQGVLVGDLQLPRLIYLLMAGVLVGAGAFGLRGRTVTSKYGRSGFGRAVFYLLIWAGLILAIVLGVRLYQDIASGGRVST